MQFTKEYKDQMNNLIRLEETPKRIICLVPSLTELLYDLGLGDSVVGITKFCIHPESWFENKTRVGGTKTVKHDKIARIKPDLIIANKEENTKEDVELLQKDYNVYVSDIFDIKDAIEFITQIGIITKTENKATELNNVINTEFKGVKDLFKSKSIAYFIWRKPYMLAGSNNIINHILEHIGLTNLIKEERYPAMEETDLKEIKPDYIFLSSEPYPFKEKHIEEFQEIFPKSKIITVDGEMFSWYGSRLCYAPKYYKTLKTSLS